MSKKRDNQCNFVLVSDVKAMLDDCPSGFKASVINVALRRLLKLPVKNDKHERMAKYFTDSINGMIKDGIG